MLHPSPVATIALLGFFAIELFLRRGAAARSWEPGAMDRGSTRAIVAAYVVVGVALALPLPGPRLGLRLAWCGAGAAWLGLLLRVVAFRTLGASYSRTLRIQDEQALVTSGIYRRIRHPGYLSALLVWIGSALATRSAVAAPLAGGVLLVAYTYRIHTEERMLREAFGERFAEYQRRSWRLLPFVY
ncbi:MAG TPA: isoprenylcysteine carboxylmethyltransferase family protein [Myxococcota bacterium]|nr:isoprenylcysteine carboxylmethyltransferase family protein [Myxococcota bacterium]